MDFVFTEYNFFYAKVFTYMYGDVSEKEGPHEWLFDL